MVHMSRTWNGVRRRMYAAGKRSSKVHRRIRFQAAISGARLFSLFQPRSDALGLIIFRFFSHPILPHPHYRSRVPADRCSCQSIAAVVHSLPLPPHRASHDLETAENGFLMLGRPVLWGAFGERPCSKSNRWSYRSIALGSLATTKPFFLHSDHRISVLGPCE